MILMILEIVQTHCMLESGIMSHFLSIWKIYIFLFPSYFLVFFPKIEEKEKIFRRLHMACRKRLFWSSKFSRDPHSLKCRFPIPFQAKFSFHYKYSACRLFLAVWQIRCLHEKRVLENSLERQRYSSVSLLIAVLPTSFTAGPLFQVFLRSKLKTLGVLNKLGGRNRFSRNCQRIVKGDVFLMMDLEP